MRVIFSPSVKVLNSKQSIEIIRYPDQDEIENENTKTWFFICILEPSSALSDNIYYKLA